MAFLRRDTRAIFTWDRDSKIDLDRYISRTGAAIVIFFFHFVYGLKKLSIYCASLKVVLGSQRMLWDL